jgi:hypothetical protein
MPILKITAFDVIPILGKLPVTDPLHRILERQRCPRVLIDKGDRTTGRLLRDGHIPEKPDRFSQLSGRPSYYIFTFMIYN